MRPPETFSTPRLTARPPRAEDASAAFTAYASDPEVTRFLVWKRYDQIKPLADYFGGRAEDWVKNNSRYVWLLHLSGEKALIGTISCFPQGDRVLFGYALGKKYWGQGLMAEALKFLVDWALSQPEVFRAWAYCDVENPGSLRVMEKAGMTREGVLRRWHVCPAIGPEPRDCVVCAKVK